MSVKLMWDSTFKLEKKGEGVGRACERVGLITGGPNCWPHRLEHYLHNSQAWIISIA